MRGQRPDRPEWKGAPHMATAEDRKVTRRRIATDANGKIIPLTEEELRLRAIEVSQCLERIAGMGEDDEKRETLAFLMQALGPDRTISNRPLFPRADSSFSTPARWGS